MAYTGLCKAGVVSRLVNSIIETACTGATTTLKAGVVCKMVLDAGVSRVQAIGVADTPEQFYGVTVMSTGLMYDGVTGVAKPTTALGVLVDGYINVKCAVGNPVRGNKVYVNLTTGEFAASNTTPQTVPAGTAEWPQAKWATDGVDSNSLGEIRLAK